MKRYKGVATLAVLCLSIPIIILAMSNQEMSVDKPSDSRWARVDLTQYCGRTIGELIDSLGDDYDLIDFLGDEIYLGGFDFRYGNVSLEIYPDQMRYCRRVFTTPDRDEYYLCDYNDIKRERIGRIFVHAFKERIEKP